MDLKFTKPVWKILHLNIFTLVINSTARCLSVIKTVEDVSTFFLTNLFLGGFL